MNDKIKSIIDNNYGKEYLKTIFACSCSNKQEKVCTSCSSSKKCFIGSNIVGFVNCDYYVYDFDSISTKANGGTFYQSVDSLVIHDQNNISFVEFTNGNPYNKKTYKKCFDSIKTIERIAGVIHSNCTSDYYFVYNSKKLDYDTYDKYKQIMYEDFFLPLLDKNATQDILIKYFKLNKAKEIFRSIYVFNEKEFLKSINRDANKWKVYS